MTATVDIVLDDEAARATAETLEVPHTTPEQSHAAALIVCAIAGRGFDLENEAHRRAAARFARPALEALGLLGDDIRRLSRGERKIIGSRVVHGSRSAVDAHREAGRALCKPCRQWARVDARKRGAPIPDDACEPAVPVEAD